MKARRLFKSLDDDETGQISFKEILNHTKDCGFPEFLPVVPVRGEAEVALGLYYKTFLLHRTCMRRAPARPMRTCLIAVQEHDLRATPVQCKAKQCFAFQSFDFALHIAEHKKEEPVCARNERPQPHPSHTRGTQKNPRFRAPASSPTQPPCKSHAAITMRFAAWRG